MEEHGRELNRFLVDVFNEILKIEEESLAGRFTDLSLRELHLIEDVCRAEDEGLDNRATAIAAAQRVTAGTLTTAVSLLEKKGYVERRRDEKDRRAVRILPTWKAREADEVHRAFHREMVAALLTELSETEQGALVQALEKIAVFFQTKYHENKERTL